jgi:hypothetical protein
MKKKIMPPSPADKDDETVKSSMVRKERGTSSLIRALRDTIWLIGGRGIQWAYIGWGKVSKKG